MLFDVGSKVHIIERRLFEGDVRRHFFGEIEHVDGAAFRATGYVFVYDGGVTTYVRSQTPRVRVFSLANAGLIINIAPMATAVEAVRYENDATGRLVVTDGAGFRLDVNEFGSKR